MKFDGTRPTGWREEGDFKAIELPYKNERFSMVAMVPCGDRKLEELEAHLNADTLENISNQMVNIHLTNCRGVVLSDNSVVLGRERSIILDGCRHIVGLPSSFIENRSVYNFFPHRLRAQQRILFHQQLLSTQSILLPFDIVARVGLVV